MQEIEISTKRLSTRKTHGRVINAIATALRDALSVPEIYLRPRIPGTSGIDLIAVDRAGSGDVHGVEVKVQAILPTRSAIKAHLAPLGEMPVHFKYLALNAPSDSSSAFDKLREYPELFDSSGIGRFGIFAFDDSLLQPESAGSANPVRLIVKPERFLVRGDKLDKLEKFLSHARPDILVRM